MIFFDYCLIDFSISKELAPLADCLKKYQGVLVADEKAFNKVVEDLEEKYRAIPKAEERFLFKVSKDPIGVISVHRNNSTKKCVSISHQYMVCLVSTLLKSLFSQYQTMATNITLCLKI